MTLFQRLTLAIAVVLTAITTGCTGFGATQPIRSVTVIYTNDEHGYMQGTREGLGADTLVELWRKEHGYRPDGNFLLLSGGDNWTGPAISSWTSGESMTEVMNAMGYDASALGNHEFDFGLDELKQRIQQANYPYLSANTRWKSSAKAPLDLGILPYTLKTVNGVRVAIIGLTTRDTPFTTHPATVSALQFIDYETALRETLPAVTPFKPHLTLVIGHVCLKDINPLARATQDLNIHLMGAGHCNELTAKTLGDTVIVGGGHHLESYATATFQVDIHSGTVVDRAMATHQRSDGELPGDETIHQLISGWNDRFQHILNEVLTHSERVIKQRNKNLEHAVVHSWLQAFPSADIAITNRGGLRSDLPAGDITLKHIVEFMPFENTLIQLELTGAELVQSIQQGGSPVIAGMSYDQARWYLNNGRQPIDPQRSYQVLVNSFMYSGGDNFKLLSRFDPNGRDTGVHYRQPFVDWLKLQRDITELAE